MKKLLPLYFIDFLEFFFAILSFLAICFLLYCPETQSESILLQQSSNYVLLYGSIFCIK